MRFALSAGLAAPALAFLSLGGPAAALENGYDCSARVEGTRAGSFNLSCLDGGEIKVGPSFIILPPECSFDGADDPTNPSYVVLQQFSFFKVGLANDEAGGVDNWRVSLDRTSGQTRFTCRR